MKTNLKFKKEFLLIIIAGTIFVYTCFQAYRSYFHPYITNIEASEKSTIQTPSKQIFEIAKTDNKEESTPQQTHISRDPLKPTLPVIIQIIEEPMPEPEPQLWLESEHIETPELQEEQEETIPAEPIILPTFAVSGIVWGQASPRAIIDGEVYRIGDTIKGALILNIDNNGVYMTYRGQKFFSGITKLDINSRDRNRGRERR